MDITFGIKTEDAAAYLNEMAQLPAPNLPDEMAELLPPNLPGQEIKIEDVKIETNSNSANELDWTDDGDDYNAIDLHRRLTMDPVDHFIQVNDTSSTKCSECGFSERQYIKTRRHKIMKQLHNKCIKKGLICPNCGLNFAQTVITRQQKLNKVRHNLCP